MNEIEWKVGAFYRTRDGRKAECVYVGLKSAYPNILKVACQESPAEMALTYTNSGKIVQCPKDFPEDILGPWVEPVPPLAEKDWPAWLPWMAMDKGETWFLYAEEPIPCDKCWVGKYMTSMPRRITPKWTGDWRESKLKRPYDS